MFSATACDENMSESVCKLLDSSSWLSSSSSISVDSFKASDRFWSKSSSNGWIAARDFLCAWSCLEKAKVDNCYQLKYFDLIRMFHTDYDLVSISHIFYICYIFMPLKGLQLYQKIWYRRWRLSYYKAIHFL